MGASRRRRACRRRVRNHTEPPDARPSAVVGAGPPVHAERSAIGGTRRPVGPNDSCRNRRAFFRPRRGTCVAVV